jgi:hypothetical protein
VRALAVAASAEPSKESPMNKSLAKSHEPPRVQRVQTGVRIEKSLLKALKALAAFYDLSLGELLEFLVLDCFSGRKPFSDDALERISALRAIYGVTIDPNLTSPFARPCVSAPDPSAPATKSARTGNLSQSTPPLGP